jgi:hypothetical protein
MSKLGANVEFHQALDALFGSIDQRDVGRPLDTSANTIRTMRTRSRKGEGSGGGPVGWEDVVLALAHRRLAELQDLITTLEKDRRSEWHRRVGLPETYEP